MDVRPRPAPLKIIGVALLVVLTLATPAGARTIVDGDDVGGKLDLRAVSFEQISGEEGRVHLKFRWMMYETWTAQQCEEAATLEDGCVVRVLLDTSGPRAWRPTGRGVDYWISWGNSECQVRDELYQPPIATGSSHKGPRSASCTFFRDRLVVKKKIRWYAFTQWANVGHGWYAGDGAPDSGWVPD